MDLALAEQVIAVADGRPASLAPARERWQKFAELCAGHVRGDEDDAAHRGVTVAL